MLILAAPAGTVAVSGGRGPGAQKTRQPSPPIGTKNWKAYRNDEYGIELRYPPDWKVIDGGAYIGFRSPRWDRPSAHLGGPTITVLAWQNVSREKALDEAGIETQEQARHNDDRPPGGFGNERYIVLLGEAGPPTSLSESTVNGMPALVADVPTRLYHGNVTKLTRYAGVGDGRFVFLRQSRLRGIPRGDPRQDF